MTDRPIKPIFQAKVLRRVVKEEMAAYSRARRAGDTARAWLALEHAHIASQPLLLPHMRVHIAMLGYAVRLRQPGEATGQLARLALAPLGSITGRLPWGNSGRSGVSAFEPMPLPRELADRMNEPDPG